MIATTTVSGILQSDGTLTLSQSLGLPPGPAVVTVAPAHGAPQTTAAERFAKLAADWKAKTKFLSNVTAKIINPEYQKIIGMGKEAIPLILKDLAENGPNDWFWALTAITDFNPITPVIAGNLVAMTEVWLQWGRKAG